MPYDEQHRIRQTISKSLHKRIFEAHAKAESETGSSKVFEDGILDTQELDTSYLPPITKYEATLLSVITSHTQRTHRIRTRASFELGSVLSPYGKTIFDNQHEPNLYGIKPNKIRKTPARLPTDDIFPRNEEASNLSKIVFKGTLTRQAISEVLGDIMTTKRLSIRAAAAKAGVNKNVIEKVRNCNATIDQGLRVLEGFGCSHEVQIMSTEPL